MRCDVAQLGPDWTSAAGVCYNLNAGPGCLQTLLLATVWDPAVFIARVVRICSPKYHTTSHTQVTCSEPLPAPTRKPSTFRNFADVGFSQRVHAKAAFGTLEAGLRAGGQVWSSGFLESEWMHGFVSFQSSVRICSTSQSKLGSCIADNTSDPTRLGLGTWETSQFWRFTLARLASGCVPWVLGPNHLIPKTSPRHP